MNFLELKEKLKDLKSSIYYQEPMSRYTTFQIGGPAECLIKVESQEELKKILKIANQNNIPITVIGNGSNVLVLDKGIKGITLMIKIEKIEIKEKQESIEIKIGAGEKLGKLARNLSKTGNNRIRGTIWHTRNHRGSC